MKYPSTIVSNPDRGMSRHQSEETPSPGTITGIVQQKKDHDRCSIHIDDTFAFGIHSELLLKEGLHRGMSLDTETIERLLMEDAYWRAWKRITHYISYRPRAELEIRRRLERDRVEESVIERVLVRLTELGLIDDRSLAIEFTRSRIRSKGYGPFRIRRDLMRMGIHRTLCDETIAEIVTPGELDALAERAGEKLWKRYSKESDTLRRRQKWSAAMLRRGFSSADASRVWDKVEREHENS